MTHRNFETAMQKGEVGERIVQALLERKGWIVYRPETSGAHCFDMLCIKDKRIATAFDVKAKSRMNKFPATGVNQKHFEEYKRFSDRHLMEFWIVFVDEGQRTIYGNSLQRLEIERVVDGKSYPWVMPVSGGIRLWPLEAMRHIARLDDDSVRDLTRFNQRSHEYSVVPAT